MEGATNHNSEFGMNDQADNVKSPSPIPEKPRLDLATLALQFADTEARVQMLMNQVNELQNDNDDLQCQVARANAKPDTWRNGMIPGDKDFQMLVWYQGESESSPSWHLVDPPDTGHDVAFFAFDRNPVSTLKKDFVKWVNVDTIYQVAQRSATNHPTGDFVRGHNP